MNNITVKTYTNIAMNHKEILRYAGMDKPTQQIDEIIDSCIKEVKEKLQYKVCFSEFPIHIDNNTIDLGFTTTTSANLANNLFNCKSVIVFAATIGLELDRLIKRYSTTTPSRAVIMQALGTERIESLCNAFNKDICNEKQILGHITKPRFSPGYGDLSINIQSDILSCLQCSKLIGIYLNDSLLMTPTKSVTALIGVS